MAIFNRDPQRAMQRDIDAAKANLTRLRAQLGEAEAAIVQHREQAKTAAVTGADGHVLDAAEAAIRAAQDRRETISAAVIEVETQLAALEQAKSEATDKAQREATAASVELLARRVLESAEVLTKAASAFGDHIAKAAAFIPEANGLLNFAHIVGREVAPAVAQTSKLLREHGAAVLDGRAAPSLPQPPAAYVPPQVEPNPPTMTLFTTHSVKWTDDAGKLRTAPQFVDVTLPLKAARRGIQLKVLIQLNDPSRKQYNRGAAGSVADRPEHALDLDEPEQPKLVEPIMQSTPPTFTVVDRGGPIPMRVATRSETS